MEDELQEKVKTATAAAKRGDFEGAYPLFREISQLYPRRADIWVWRAVTSKDPEETLACLSRALELDPENRSARDLMHKAMQGQLENDPFLRYVRETAMLYVVNTNDELKITIPKERAIPPPPPPRRKSPLDPVYRWLWISGAGLLLGGFGALAGVLVTFFIAWRIPQSSLTETERKSLSVAKILAGLIFLLGCFVSFIFLIHL